MRDAKHTMFAAAGYLLLAATLILITSLPGNSQSGQQRDVRVINTTSERVPVALPAGTPFGATGSPEINVPATGRLTVETLSVQVNVSPSGSKMETFVNYTSGGNTVTLFLPVTYAYTEANGFDFYVATESVRLYPDPGTPITVSGYSPTGETGTLFVTASGHLN